MSSHKSNHSFIIDKNLLYSQIIIQRKKNFQYILIVFFYNYTNAISKDTLDIFLKHLTMNFMNYFIEK